MDRHRLPKPIMRRFMVESIPEVNECVLFSQEEKNHALRVLRMTQGEQIELSDGAGNMCVAELVINNDELYARVLYLIASRESPVSITLYQGLPKFEKLELVAQKATELGANSITALSMERSVVKLKGDDIKKKLERVDKIVKEAVKQCGRSVCPTIRYLDSINKLPKHDIIIVPWEEEEALTLKELYNSHSTAKDIAIVIGPEGGISAAEIEKLKQLGAYPVTLGKRILRTETASIAAITLVQHLWGDI